MRGDFKAKNSCETLRNIQAGKRKQQQSHPRWTTVVIGAVGKPELGISKLSEYSRSIQNQISLCPLAFDE